MARLPPSRHPLHCSLRIPDLRARNDSPLRRSCHHALPAICLTRRLSAQTIRRCGLNATFRTRLQQCGGDWWPLSSRRSRAAHAAPLATDTEICDTVRLGRCICWRRRISRSTRANCACGALSPAAARIARFRSFPTRSSCAVHWCPGVVRLKMDGVQPAKVSDLLSRKSAAARRGGDRAP